MNAKITSFRSKYRSFCDLFDGYPTFDMLSILGIKDFLRLQCVEFKISVFCVATPRRDLHASKPEGKNHDCKHKYLDKKPLFKHDVGSGGVRHGPQRVMGKNITDVHFTLGTMK